MLALNGGQELDQIANQRYDAFFAPSVEFSREPDGFRHMKTVRIVATQNGTPSSFEIGPQIILRSEAGQHQKFGFRIVALSAAVKIRSQRNQEVPSREDI